VVRQPFPENSSLDPSSNPILLKILFFIYLKDPVRNYFFSFSLDPSSNPILLKILFFIYLKDPVRNYFFSFSLDPSSNLFAKKRIQ